MLLQLFDSDSGNMMEELVVPNGHVMVRKFSVNIPINFSIVCERLVKNFSFVTDFLSLPRFLP